MAFNSFLCCVKPSSLRKGKKQEVTWRIFSLKELHSATNNFNYDNKLGEGGFGSVYWGQLWDGSQIAVKRLKVWGDKPEVDFAIEIEILARVQHKNLLNLRGYCAQGQERLVVYDYMPNLSLYSHIHGHNSAECILDWKRRMSIALGAAQGIAYLHHHATPHMIHTYIKPSNILLDSDFQARVADFGFTRIIPDGVARVTTRGYIAPEYAMTGKASESCDVYSFGILLLELVTGKKPIQKVSETEKRGIADWALPLAKQRRFSDLVDEKLNGIYVEDELKRVVFVALVCVQDRPEKRPTMLDVVEMLKRDSKEKIQELEKSELFENEEVTGEDGDLVADKLDRGVYNQKEGKEESWKLQDNEEIEKV